MEASPSSTRCPWPSAKSRRATPAALPAVPGEAAPPPSQSYAAPAPEPPVAHGSVTTSNATNHRQPAAPENNLLPATQHQSRASASLHVRQSKARRRPSTERQMEPPSQILHAN